MSQPDPYAIMKTKPSVRTFLVGAMAFSVALSLNEAVKTTLDERFKNGLHGIMGNTLAHWLYVVITIILAVIVMYLADHMEGLKDTLVAKGEKFISRSRSRRTGASPQFYRSL